MSLIQWVFAGLGTVVLVFLLLLYLGLKDMDKDLEGY